MFKGAPSHGLFGRGKMPTVKVAVNLPVKKTVEACGDDVYEVKLHPSNTKGFESSNKPAGEMECYTWSTP